MLKRIVKKENILIYLSMLIISFILVLINTAMSPMFDQSYITADASVFYVMGRAIKRGIVPYKNLFDHKGLYIYFVYFLCALIGEKHSIGLWVIFSLLAFFLFIMVYKIVLLYKDRLISFLTSFIIVILSTTMMFCHNAILCEYPALLCITASIYITLKSDIYNIYKPRYMFINGVLFGICLFLKANYCIYFASVAICALVSIFKNKQYILIFKYMFYGLFGIIIGISPVIIYCVVNDCIKEMFECVFIFNFKYSNELNIDLPKEITTKFQAFIHTLDTYRNMFLVCIISFFILLYKKINIRVVIFYSISLLLLCFSVIFAFRGYSHYLSLLLPYIIPSIVISCDGLYNFIVRPFENKSYLSNIIVVTIVCVLIAISNIFGGQFLRINFSYLANQYRKINKEITKHIEVNDNIDFLCAGLGTSFYNYNYIIPKFKYFYIPSIHYHNFPEPVDSLYEYIDSKKPDIVLYSKCTIFEETDYGIRIEDSLETNYTKLSGNFDMEDYFVYIRNDLYYE